MNTDKRIQLNKEVPGDVLALCRDAKVNDCWIYHTKSKKFYTPEEFLENWKTLVFVENRGVNNAREYIVKSPYVAIKQRAEWVAKANQELQDIIKKLEDYEVEFKLKK